MSCSSRTHWGSMLWIAMILAIAAAPVTPVAAQIRVVNYNVAQLNGDHDALEAVFAALSTDDVPGFTVAPHIFLLQEVKSANVGTLLSLLNDAAPPGVSYAAGTYTNSGEDGSGGAQALFYRPDTIIELSGLHDDISTGGGRDSDRWVLKIVGYDSPDARLYVYSSHLKAGNDGANEAIRLNGVNALRAHADATAPGGHVIFAGDMNIYDNGESGYLRFLDPGASQVLDPFGSGSWAGSGQAIKHSQSPLASNSNGLIGGGMDDRFDFQLPTTELHDGDGLAIIPGTYRSLGNDGQHFNTSINSGNNFYYPGEVVRSNALADALHAASDHIPVVAEYQVPAIVGATLPLQFGRIIVGTPFTVSLIVKNDAPVVDPIGADVLDYTAIAGNAFSGVYGGSVDAGGDTDIHLVPVATDIVGGIGGTVLIQSSNEAVEGDGTLFLSTGQVVRPASPSLSGARPVTAAVVEASFAPDSGVQAIPVDVFNLDYDNDQALMDIDAVSPPDAPLAYVGGDADGIGATPATLTYTVDTAGLAPGDYEATSSLLVSDEDIPGASIGLLTITFQVTIIDDGGGDPIPGDLDGDGVVGPVDLAALLAAWGSGDEDADLDGDGTVGASDLATLLANWG